ncbi:hypothetical protein BDM02DRAFT_3189092 [Thelephora ganbajun]|uniref:Uncharacterized protein n=1 Tax=Thelephora ganbajun TaxID=370292 RepID=A0ACB6Z9H5_THEGA|nr:hypothetical protein BDM02DRAFT_3189092 [Thelephora ganbajun]
MTRTFGDLPAELVILIVSFSDPLTTIALTEVSRALRTLIYSTSYQFLLHIHGYQDINGGSTEQQVALGVRFYEHRHRTMSKRTKTMTQISVFGCALQVMGDCLILVPRDLSGHIFLRTFRSVIKGVDPDESLLVFWTEIYSFTVDQCARKIGFVWMDNTTSTTYIRVSTPRSSKEFFYFESKDYASNILLGADLYRVELEFCGDLLGVFAKRQVEGQMIQTICIMDLVTGGDILVISSSGMGMTFYGFSFISDDTLVVATTDTILVYDLSRHCEGRQPFFQFQLGVEGVLDIRFHKSSPLGYPGSNSGAIFARSDTSTNILIMNVVSSSRDIRATAAGHQFSGDAFVIHMQTIAELKETYSPGTILDSSDWYRYMLQVPYHTPVGYDSRNFFVSGSRAVFPTLAEDGCSVVWVEYNFDPNWCQFVNWIRRCDGNEVERNWRIWEYKDLCFATLDLAPSKAPLDGVTDVMITEDHLIYNYDNRRLTVFGI